MRRLRNTDATGRRYWLTFEGQKLALAGDILVGRSPGCHLLLGDDPLVSRNHARLSVVEEGVWLEDLGSANGVFVDDQRLTEPRILADGARIRIGKRELLLNSGTESQAPQSRREFAQTRESASPRDVTQTVSEAGDDPESTGTANVFELLGGVVDKALSIGNKAEAERILSPVLQRLRDDVVRNQELRPDLEPQAIKYTLKLAEATGRGKWVDELIGLYAIARRPIPTSTTDRLYQLIRRVDRLDLQRLRAYLADLESQHDRFTPAERFACKRLEGLEKIASLK